MPNSHREIAENIFCKTVEEARQYGWIRPYEGGRAADNWKGRIYGRKPGNHRIFRCTAEHQTQR